MNLSDITFVAEGWGGKIEVQCEMYTIFTFEREYDLVRFYGWCRENKVETSAMLDNSIYVWVGK